MNTKRRIARLEQTFTRNWTSIEAALALIEYKPPTAADLRTLQEDLSIPDMVMVELFGARWQG